MGTKNSEKKSDSGELEKIISPILVVSHKRLRPYLELFEHYPENISHQGLGILIGFFKINERSDDSAYIVNFISSVLKKEYYANPKRPVEESFDAALHKVNLALAEIAKNGNIRWIGQMDAALCVLDKNLLHFTVCGVGQILLLRNQNLSEIGKDLNPDEIGPNPLKTFTNVSSGYLEKDDKLIITSPDLFNIFSFNELKKGSSRFDREKFVRFLKTALNNETESGATIVVDVTEAPRSEKPKKNDLPEEDPTFNPFSEKAFLAPKAIPEKTETGKGGAEGGYTDERTGHIYVQGKSGKPEEVSFGDELLFRFGDRLSFFFHWLKKKSLQMAAGTGRAIVALPGALFSSLSSAKKIIGDHREKRRLERAEKEKSLANPDLLPISETVIPAVEEDFIPDEIEPLPENEESAISEKQPSFFSFLPSFSRIGLLFGRLSYSQKIYSALIIILILFSPLIFSRLREKPELPVETPPVAAEPERDPVLDDKNIRTVDIQTAAFSLTGAEKILLINDKLFAVTPEKILLVDGSAGTEFPFPASFSDPTFTIPMEDLNLIFLLSAEGKFISFSPVSRAFKENTLIIPDRSEVRSASAYLTYLYLADAKERQIYRYPRAVDGFGEKTAWLKDPLDLSKLRDMAIEENIYLAFENELLKFFRGAKVDFTLEKPNVPLIISKIHTGPDLSNLYILDSQNSRVIRYSKSGQLLDQYYNPETKKATAFTADEKNNKIFLVGPEGLFSFGM